MGYTSVQFGIDSWLRSPCNSCIKIEADKVECSRECKRLGRFQQSLDNFIQANPGYCMGR